MSTQAIVPEILAPNVVLSHEVVPLLATIVSTNREAVAAKLLQLETRGLELAARMSTLVEKKIADQATYDEAAAAMVDYRAFSKESTEYVEPIRSLTYDLYQMVLNRKKGIQGAPERVGSLLTVEIINFERRQAELQHQRDREVAEAQRREEEERKLQSAAAAEQAGMDKTSVDAILAEPSSAPTPVAPPVFQRAAGVATREAWCAEVTDLWALVKAAAKNKQLLPLLEANMPALNAQARSLKTALAIPGVRAVDKGSVAVRGARS